MKKTTLFWLTVSLAPVVLALSVWTVIACVNYLQSPPGYGGARIDAGGKLEIGPKPPDLTTPLVLSVFTVPLGVAWIVLLTLWKHGQAEGPRDRRSRSRKATRRSDRER